jgi:predicted thioredoxin/glutaredoxin
MKIELILDKNCLSAMTYMEMMNQLAEEFSSDEIILTSFENDRQRLRNLGIRLLPAWIIDNKLLRINPGDYESIRKQILLKNDGQHT